MNETQALNWARVASAVAQKSASRELEEDLVQSALLAILEDDSDDLVDKAWNVRAGIRNPLRRIARDRAETGLNSDDGTSPWLAEHDTPHPSWLQMLDEEDTLSRRIREAYSDEEVADEAVKASASNGYWGIEEGARTDDEPQPGPRGAEPIYMQPDYRLDFGEVDLAEPGFRPNYYDIDGEPVHWKHIVYWLGNEAESVLQDLGKRAVKHAWEQGLSPVEAAVFANRVARMAADEAPQGKEGLYYSIVRYAAGDYMALAEGRRTTLHAEDEVVESPGVTSGYGIEDDEVWMWLFPDGPGNERYELPRGTDDDILALVEAVGDRVQPEHVAYGQVFVGEDEQYLGWNLWDVKEARQAHVRSCLLGLNDWRACALAGRKAFWGRKGHNQLLARNYAALRAEGLARDKDRGYKVTWAGDRAPDRSPSKPSPQYLDTNESYWAFITGA